MPNARPNYKKANWSKYTRAVENHLEQANLPASSETENEVAITELVNAIRAAEIEAVPMERSRNKTKPKISQETIDVIKLRNNTRRLWQRCTDIVIKPLYKPLVNAQDKEIKRLIRNDFNKRWNNTLKSVKPGDNKLQTLSKKMLNKNSNDIEVLDDGVTTKLYDLSKVHRISDVMTIS